MIKLKLTVKEFKALSIYLQTCINIMRQEITSGGDFKVTRIGESSESKINLWDSQKREENILRVASRNAQIDLFSRLQMKIINTCVRSVKQRSISIQKIEGSLIIEFIPRSIPVSGNKFISLVINDICAPVILKNLI